MGKQITTVYVPTDEAPYFIVKDVEKEFIKARVTEQEAYLYTPEEHAAVLGYREALEKILDTNGKDDMFSIAAKALSKAEYKGYNGWISVEDRLPESCTEVLAFSENGYGVEFLYFDGDKCFYNEKSDVRRTPTHWQPLPPKP